MRPTSPSAVEPRESNVVTAISWVFSSEAEMTVLVAPRLFSSRRKYRITVAWVLALYLCLIGGAKSYEGGAG